MAERRGRSVAPPSAYLDGRASRWAATHESLVRAARCLFSNHGYRATTVNQIASLAGVSERTFFLHFPSKRDVLFDLPGENIDDFGQLVAEVGPEFDDLAAIQRAMTEWHTKRGDQKARHSLFCHLIDAAESDPMLRTSMFDYNQALVDAAANGLAKRRGEPGPGPSPTSVMTAAIAMRIYRLIVQEWARSDPHSFAAVADRQFRLLRQIMRSH